MKQCEITTGQYVSIVKNLIKLNPGKYRNFDKTAEFILKSGLSNNEKSLSLFSISEIYIGLNELDSSFYEVGNAVKVANAKVLLNTPDDFIASISNLYNVKKSPGLKVETIEKKIQELSNMTTITGNDLTGSAGVLTAIKNYFNTHEFESLEEREEVLKSISKELKDVIRDLKTTNSQKEFLLKRIDTVVESLDKKSEFISLREIASLAELNNVLVTFKNNQIMEATEKPEGLFIMTEDGNEFQIDEEDLISTKLARNDDYSRSNAGQQEFFEDTITSNFKIQPVENDIYLKEKIENKLKDMGDNPSAGVRIFAVQLSGVGDDRLNRIHSLAKSNPKFKGLANRTFETFENETQINYLKSTSKGTVITVARPQKADSKFVLMGEIIGTGEKFYLYPLDNYVFLNSDNTTQKIDFSNPVHLAKVKELSIKRLNDNTQTELTEDDLLNMKNAFEVYKDFKENLSQLVEPQFSEDVTSVDVTQQFFSQYNIGSQAFGKETRQNLADVIDYEPSLSRKLTIATTDGSGNILKEEERNVVFAFSKVKDKKDQKTGLYPDKDKLNKFILVNTLGINERIVVKDENNGVIDIVSQEDYLTMYFDPNVKLTDEYIKDNILKGKYVETTTNIIIRFNNNGTYGYRVVRPVFPLSQEQGFATFITTLADVLNAPNKQSQLNQFNRNVYSFKTFTSKNGKIELYVNFASDMNGHLQVEIRPVSNTGKYGFIADKDIKSDFNFSFRPVLDVDGKTILSPENDLRKLAASLRGGKLVQKVIDENIVFSELDLTKQKDLAKFYSLLNELSKDKNPSENVIALVDEIKKQQQKFSELIVDRVINKLLENGKKYPGFIENFMEDFPDPKHLVVDVNEDGFLIPRIEFSNNNKSQARQDFDKSISSFDLKNIPTQKLVITSKTPSGKNTPVANVQPLEVTNHPIENIPISQPVSSPEYTEGTTTDNIDLTDDIPEIDMFSISNTEVQTETEAERQNAVQWLQEILPQFNVSQEDISTIVDLAAIDGTVLGMFKDRVIYLNNNILSKGVVYHEAFHGVFRYLMTPEQRSKLIDVISSNKKYKKAFTPAALKKFASERNYVYDYEKMFQLKAEEILADGFQNYMNKNTKPQGLVAKLFEILKNLIDMFTKKGNLVDSTYKDIQRGYYTKMQIQSNIYDGQAAYELIPGLKKIINDKYTASGVSQYQSTLLKAEQNQLVNMVTKYIIENKSAQTFDEKFKTAQRLILDKVYNIDELVKKNPDKASEIVSKYGNLISQYRFMLGARATGETIYDINATENDAYDKRLLPNKVKQYEADPLDNDLGQVSLDVLKKLVQKKTQELYSILDGSGDTLDKQLLLKELAGENEKKSQVDEDYEDSEELSDDVSFDEGFGEHNRLDSAPRQIRRFLAIINYEREDADLGITFPRVIDGEKIYGTLLKITSDIPVGNIIEQIKSTADIYKEDGNTDAAADLEAVYNQLKDYTSMDENGNPSANHELYNMFVDVLHGTETDYMMMHAILKTGLVEEEGNNIENFTLGDSILKADALKKRRDLIASIITTHAKKRTDPDYLSAVNRLLALSDSIINKKTIIGSVKQANKQLEELTFDLYNAFKNVGINLPKSLIRMSILAIDKIDNSNSGLTEVNEKTLKHYDNNSNFIADKAFLQKDFFRDIKAIYSTVANESISSNAFGKMLDENNENFKRFFSITNKFSKYLLKYDATDLPSVFRNAAGKPVYRYTKYTPLISTAQSVRRNGLESTLEKDPYYADFLKDFYADNPLFADLLAGKDTPQARKAKLLMDNMNISLFGGIAQFNNQTYKIGKTFGKLDDQSLHVMSILSFLQRTTVSSFETVLDEDGNPTTISTSFQTFLRTFDTLEASQTNFLITSIYQQYADKNGLVKDGKHLKIVSDLEAKVKQEFNRIKREYNSRTESKSNFDSGTSNRIVNKYNGVLSKDDKTKADVEAESLRAYNFNYLPYFFAAPENELLTETLLNLAKDKDIAFEDIDESTLADLRDGLNNYAMQELNTYINTLKDLGVVTERTETVKALKKDPSTGRTITDEQGNPIVFETKQPEIRYLQSSLIADKLKIDYNKPVSTTSVYAGTKPNYSITGELESRPDLTGLLADYFFNQWYNSLMINDIFQGDKALNVKDGIDSTKRNKKFLASGSTMKEGLHTVAYLNTIEGYISEDYPQYGPYYSPDEVLNDTQITDDAVRDKIFRNFRFNQKVFDGQSISTLFHQADMHDSMGRLTPEILRSLIAKQYRELTEEEVRNMEKNKVVNNPKKTVTASRNVYHKQSEAYIDRNDVSVLIVPEDKTTDQVYDELHSKYMYIYSLRNKIQAYNKINQTGEFNSAIEELERDIQNTYVKIHAYYEPLPNRVKLHKILNSMEYHNIDQLMDTEASKNATKLPVDFFAHESQEYLPLNLSSLKVNNEDKYLQVETSGVKDTARFSVQGKILLPADLKYIEQLAEKRHAEAGTVMSDSERKAMNQLGDVLVEYQESLYDIADSNLQSLKHFMRKGADFDLSKVFTLIRENLETQNAPASVLKLFDVDASGKPVHSPNLPGIRSMLEYYFFSLYSKHVTDEKGSGFKNIHVSSFGYDVLEDENGEIVTTEEYKRNPSNYRNVKSRPLGVRIEAEYDPNGELVSKKYFVECVLPKQFFRSQQQEDFFMENLREMFALRIPTEDKRSMIVLKVVDYVDSSNLNTIIVPQFIHLLAGSDFDVDSLYGQTYAHYVNAVGEYSKYGNYDVYTSPAIGKYIEYVHYMSNDENFKKLINAKRASILESGKFNPSANTLEIMYGMGYTQEDYVKAVTAGVYEELDQYDDDLIDDIQQIKQEKAVTKEAFIQSIQDTENDPEDYVARANRRKLGKEHYDLKVELDETYQELKRIRDEKRRIKTFVKGSLRIEAALQVFEKYGLPLDQANFDSNIVNHLSVLPIHQNKNLEAKINILSNEAVFKNLYIHERSSVELFEDIVEGFGRDLENFGPKSDPNTITSVIESKALGSAYKDMIGIAASLQKFLALASQYELELNSENVIWKFLSNDLQSDGSTKVTENNLFKFGAINKNGQRTIELNGNILGMAADGMKKPIPAALEMNEVNTGVTLAMIGIGLDPAFAFGFNFIPEIKQAIYNVQASRFAISDSTSSEFLFLNNEIQNVIADFVKNNGDRKLLNELIDAELITPDSFALNVKINKENLMIDFQQKPLDEFRLDNNTLSVEDIGFEVSAYSKGVKTELSNEAQKLILLQLYKEQAQQTFKIRNAGSIVDLYKKLNPSFVSNDRLYKNINDLRNGESIFTVESSDKLFEGKQVWVPLTNALDDLHEQASKIFLERTSFFQPIKNIFDTVYTDPSNIARIITSFIAIRKYQLSLPGSRKSTNPSMQANFDADDKNLLETFTADYWFTNTLEKELDEMKDKYPNNKFLQFLKVSNNTASALTTDKESVQEKTLQMVSKAKIAGELADDIADDAFFLFNQENMFVKKLFYHELARTGLQYKSGSFLQYLPAELQIPLSKNVDAFIKAIESTRGNKKELIEAIKSFVGDESVTTQEEVYKLFDDLFILMAHGASKEVGNKKIKGVSKISYSEAEGFESKFMKNINFQTTDATEKLAIVNKIVGNVLGLIIDPKNKGGFLFTDRLSGNEKLEDFVINMNGAKSIPEATEKAVMAIGEKLNIFKDKDDKNKFKFPLMLKLGTTTYLLQGVDEEIGNKSFGKSVINAIAGVGEYRTTGRKARYVALPMELTTNTLSPIGFSTAQSKRYQKLVTKKERIDMSEVDMSFGLTAEMFEDYSIKETKGVEISSNAKGLAAALTNPTELAKSKGNLTQSYPVEFRGKVYKDAETAYQALKGTATKDDGPNNTYNLMVDIIKAKLQQHPKLVSEINKKGGSAWILSSTHQPTNKNTVWETGGQNWFIKSLNDAYIVVTQPEIKTSTSKVNVTELFESNPDLADKVYEALGFKTKTSENEITRGIKEVLPYKVIGDYSNIEEGLIGRRQYEIKIGDDTYVFEISNYNYENEDGTYQPYYDIDFTVNGSEELVGTGFFDKSEKAKQIIQAIISQNFGNDTIRFNVEESKKGKQRLGLYKRLMSQLGYNPSDEIEYALFYDIKTDKVNLTPQQKQQAQQLYSQYIEQTGKQDIEGFEQFVNDTKLNLDIQNINVTFDVVKHFYELSGKRQSFEAYAKTFADMAAQLKTTGMTNQEILEKLKCL